METKQSVEQSPKRGRERMSVERRKEKSRLAQLLRHAVGSPPTSFGGFPRQKPGKGASEEQRVGLARFAPIPGLGRARGLGDRMGCRLTPKR